MANAKGRTWKTERASVSTSGKTRSNKYSKSDSHKKPAAASRDQVWVGGYERADGTRIKGHYRATPR